MSITYHLYIPQPHTHEFEVEILIENYVPANDFLIFKMPVWTAGSYLIREYAKNIQEVKVLAENQILTTQKINKNTWKVSLEHQNQQNIKISYKGYAFESSVRTNYIDNSHIFLNGAATFMYLPEFLENSFQLCIHKPVDMPFIFTALKSKGNDIFEVKNYDELVDSPIEINNCEPFFVDFQHIKHTFAFHNCNISKEKLHTLKQNLLAIIEASTSIFGVNPCDEYLTISHFVEKGYGGLEHKNSTALIFKNKDFETKKGYIDFLTLFAHEYFHLWNIKRLAPADLFKIDYEQENYTTLLWQVEGFTTYFQDVIMRKANLITEDEFLTEQQKRIQTIENQYGNKIQSLAESSLDAWIKAYRPNENSPNATISYYTKGAIIALWLDILILEASQGEKSLENLIKEMYENFYVKQKRGFDENELKNILENYTKQNLDEFWKNYIHGTKEIPYHEIFEKLGVKVATETPSKVELGIKTTKKGRITFVKKGSNAFEKGLQVNDKIIAINNNKIKDLPTLLEKKSIGDVLHFTIFRNGILQQISVTLNKNTEKTYTLTKPETENNLWIKWTRKIIKSDTNPDVHFSKLTDFFKKK
jgi:predicted metalloprotease with PDZ domain